MRSLVILCLGLLPMASIAQKQRPALAVRLALPAPVVHDSLGLLVTVSIKNVGKKDKSVYRYLVEGDRANQFCNISLEMEKQAKGRFLEYEYGLIRDVVPPLEFYTIDTTTLRPADSLLFFLHLDKAYFFHPGEYRLRGIYTNDIGIVGPEKYFPKRRDVYTSPWIYFRVEAIIKVSHYYNEH